jgi:hypothetical protein
MLISRGWSFEKLPTTPGTFLPHWGIGTGGYRTSSDTRSNRSQQGTAREVSQSPEKDRMLTSFEHRSESGAGPVPPSVGIVARVEAIRERILGSARPNGSR